MRMCVDCDPIIGGVDETEIKSERKRLSPLSHLLHAWYTPGLSNQCSPPMGSNLLHFGSAPCAPLLSFRFPLFVFLTSSPHSLGLAPLVVFYVRTCEALYAHHKVNPNTLKWSPLQSLALMLAHYIVVECATHWKR